MTCDDMTWQHRVYPAEILIGSSQFDFSKDGSEATESIDLEKADAEAAGAGVGKTLSRGTEETADEAGKSE